MSWWKAVHTLSWLIFMFTCFLVKGCSHALLAYFHVHLFLGERLFTRSPSPYFLALIFMFSAEQILRFESLSGSQSYLIEKTNIFVMESRLPPPRWCPFCSVLVLSRYISVTYNIDTLTHSLWWLHWAAKHWTTTQGSKKQNWIASEYVCKQEWFRRSGSLQLKQTRLSLGLNIPPKHEALA